MAMQEKGLDDNLPFQVMVGFFYKYVPRGFLKKINIF
jgi:hypothetical protein